MKMPDFIAGKPVPKWFVPDSDDLEAVIQNIQTKPDEQNQSKLKILEDTKKLRTQLGICNKCRLRDCLCREGQI